MNAESPTVARTTIGRASATAIWVDGRELVDFGSASSLGLAHHPEVAKALDEALARFGLGATSARHAAGTTSEHERLESELAWAVQQESAALVSDPALAPLALAQALADEHTLVLIDEHSDPRLASAFDAAGVERLSYAHCDAAHATRLAEAHAKRKPLIATSGVFPSTGRVAPLPALLRALPPQESWLVVDDAHGFGALEPHGRGSLEYHGLADTRCALALSLAHAFGCVGGAIAGAAGLIERVRARSNALRTSRPLAAPLAAAARAALRVHFAEPDRLATLFAHVERVRAHLARLGATIGEARLSVLAFAFPPRERMLVLHRELAGEGLWVPLVDGPRGAQLSIALSAAHDARDIDRLLGALEKMLPARTP